MSKNDKREQKIRTNTKNVSLEDFETLVKRYGEIVEGRRHPKAHINGHYFSYPRENPVNRKYIEHILAIIDGIAEE
jgi:hypothetical protein